MIIGKRKGQEYNTSPKKVTKDQQIRSGDDVQKVIDAAEDISKLVKPDKEEPKPPPKPPESPSDTGESSGDKPGDIPRLGRGEPLA